MEHVGIHCAGCSIDVGKLSSSKFGGTVDSMILKGVKIGVPSTSLLL